MFQFLLQNATATSLYLLLEFIPPIVNSSYQRGGTISNKKMIRVAVQNFRRYSWYVLRMEVCKLMESYFVMAA